MANVSVPVTLTSDLFTFTRGRNKAPTEPYGQLTLSVIAPIVSKAGSDTNVITVSGSFPRNFVYRPAEIQAIYQGISLTDMLEPQNTMLGLWSENQVVKRRFSLTNLSTKNSYETLGAVTDSTASWHANSNAITNDFSAVCTPIDQPGLFTDVVNASEGVSQLQVTWLNDSSAATAAMQLIFYSRWLMYTVEQFHDGSMWVSQPVIA